VQPTTDQRIPSLDDIARDPGCVVGLPTRMLAGLQARAAAAVAGLAAAVLAGSDGGNQAQPKSSTMGLLNTEQMAAFLKVKESWVASEARAGRIPKKMVGRYVRFDPAEVESAVSERGIVCR
jgi:hypothetical protein